VAKKWQVLIVVVITAVFYLGLLVGLPALAEIIGPCYSCNKTEVVDSTTNLTANATLIFEVLDSEGIDLNKPPTYIEMFEKTWIIYVVPGMVSVAVIATILKKKRYHSGKEEQ